MSIKQVSKNNISNSTSKTLGIIESDSWVRNPLWREVVPPSEGEQKIVILVAVPKDTSYFMMNAQGAYTVDWGDGTSNNYSSLAVATKAYDSTSYNHANLNDTNRPVTFTDATNTVNRNNHGLSNGSPVIFYDIETTTGIMHGATYYVINSSTNSFQIAKERNGTAVNFINDGTGALLPYKQAIITLTPQAGQNLTLFTTNNYGAGSVPNSGYYTNHSLEMHISAPNLATFNLGNPGSNTVIRLNLLEWVNIVSSFSLTLPTTQTNQTFLNLHKLQCVTSHSQAIFGGNAQGLFQNCYSLKYVSGLNVSTATTASSMFRQCYSLQKVNGLNLAACTDLQNMFNECRSLVEAPALLNTGSVTIVTSMFVTCVSLKRVPKFNMNSVTNASNMFRDCTALEEAPEIDAPIATSFSTMFMGCNALKYVPSIKTTTLLTNTEEMFRGCTSLKKVETFNTDGVTSALNMFTTCSSLPEAPSLSFNAVTSTYRMFYFCGAMISAAGIRNLNNLQNASEMFSFCYALQYPPRVSSSSLTNTASMFFRCNALLIAPLMNTANVTTVTDMFAECVRIDTIPAYNLQNSGFNIATSADAINISRIKAYNISRNATIPGSGRMHRTEIEEFMTNGLTRSLTYGSPTLTMGGIPVERTLVTLTGTTTVGSTTVTMANTTGLSVGMEISGTNISSASAATIQASADTVTDTAHGLSNGTSVSFTGFSASVTFQDTGDTVTLNNHGLSNADIIRFTSITSTTGISINTNYFVRNVTTNTFQLSTSSSGGSIIALTTNGSGTIFMNKLGSSLLHHTAYFVVNAATDTFQVASTLGGAAIDLPLDVSTNILYPTTITAITPNTNITLSVPATGSGSVSTTSGVLKRSIARLKGFTVSG
jgi:hypothetical protein